MTDHAAILRIYYMLSSVHLNPCNLNFDPREEHKKKRELISQQRKYVQVVRYTLRKKHTKIKVSLYFGVFKSDLSTP
jgi:hypothetical protein